MITEIHHVLPMMAAREGSPSVSRPSLASFIRIGGKRTVQRSIRFPEREGQSRIFQYKTHLLFIQARPLVKSPQKSSSGCAQVFHTVLSPFVHAFNLAWRSKHDVQRNSASGAQSNE